MNPAYNTLSHAQKLQTTGFPQPQAEAIVESVTDAINTVATKEDINLVRMDSELHRAANKADLDLVRTDLELHRAANKADLDEHRAETKAGFDLMRSDFAAHRTANKADLDAHRTANKADLDAHRAATTADIDLAIEKLKVEMMRWGLGVAAISLTIIAILNGLMVYWVSNLGNP